MSHIFFLDLNDERIQLLKNHTSESGSDCLKLYGSITLYKQEPTSSEVAGTARDQICFLAIPDFITIEDILDGIGETSEVVNAFKIIDAKTGQNSLFLQLENERCAKVIHQKWNGREGWPSRNTKEICHALFVSELHLEGDNFDSTELIELPTCPVCLERLDLRVSGVFAHSHVGSTICRCTDLWEDIDCYVCRLFLTQHNQTTPTTSPRVAFPSPRIVSLPSGSAVCPPVMTPQNSDPGMAYSPAMLPRSSDSSMSDIQHIVSPPPHFRRSSTPIPGSVCHAANCTVNEDLWICLHCGLLSCGRNHNQHSVRHYEEFPNHRFCADLLHLYVWDYKGDVFVHRIFSGADLGLSRHLLEIATNEDMVTRSLEDEQGAEQGADLMQAKVATMTEYYNIILTDTLSQQQAFYEEKLTKENQHFDRELQKLRDEQHELTQHAELINLGETHRKLRQNYLELLGKKKTHRNKMKQLELEQSTQIKKVLKNKRTTVQQLEEQIAEMMGNFQ